MPRQLCWATCSSGGSIRLGRKRVKEPPLPRTAFSTPPEGGVSKTGTWRIYRPIIDLEKCTKCLLCWLYCPEGTIKVNNESKPEIDLSYCKGCGICAKECPIKIIVMRFEGEIRNASKGSVNR